MANFRWITTLIPWVARLNVPRITHLELNYWILLNARSAIIQIKYEMSYRHNIFINCIQQKFWLLTNKAKDI